MARISHVTWFRSWLFHTATTSRGSSHWWRYFAAVISSAIPFICIAPSPTSAIAGRSGCANFAPITYGTPQPIVASVPESEPRMPGRMVRCRAYQFAVEPESEAMIALSGSSGSRARATYSG